MRATIAIITGLLLLVAQSFTPALGASPIGSGSDDCTCGKHCCVKGREAGSEPAPAGVPVTSSLSLKPIQAVQAALAILARAPAEPTALSRNPEGASLNPAAVPLFQWNCCLLL